jgi:hypothetical protein
VVVTVSIQKLQWASVSRRTAGCPGAGAASAVCDAGVSQASQGKHGTSLDPIGRPVWKPPLAVFARPVIMAPCPEAPDLSPRAARYFNY